jgi:hypothetical protein
MSWAVKVILFMKEKYFIERDGKVLNLGDFIKNYY